MQTLRKPAAMPIKPETRLIEMIFPDQANHYGTLFGGNALALMAKAAFVAATRHAGCAVVMARSERVDFTTPIHVGALLELTADVIRCGRSSMTVEVHGLTRSIGGGDPRRVLSGRFEMVAVDPSGRPHPLADTLVNEGQNE